MRRIPKYSPYIFSIIAAIKVGFDTYVTLKAPRVFEAQDMFNSISGIQLLRVDMNSILTLAASLAITAVSVIAAYFICRSFYRKINADDEETLSKFKNNHFTIMSFKYLGLLMTGMISYDVFGNNPGLVVSIMMSAVNAIFVVTACILIFGYDENKKVKVKENTLLYAIMALM